MADDEPIIVDSVARFFTQRGHRVQTATDADSAVALADMHRFDVALVDARMPGNGTTVVARLTASRRFRGRIVLMTGSLAEDPSISVGPDVVRVQKPFRLSDLAGIVEGGGPA